MLASLGSKEAEMRLIGCDLHASQQSIAMLHRDTGVVTRRLDPGEIVAVEIEILASSTLFEAGSSLLVDVLGHDADRYPAFRHGRTVNRGTHTIHEVDDSIPISSRLSYLRVRHTRVTPDGASP
jgi:predicted acyl esterase